jgi:hypothetical protein
VFVMLVGALVGVCAGAVALALFGFGFRLLGPKWSRALALLTIVAASVALLLTTPAWRAVLTGKGSRGEAFYDGPIDLSFVLVLVLILAAPPVTIALLVRRLLKGAGRS